MSHNSHGRDTEAVMSIVYDRPDVPITDEQFTAVALLHKHNTGNNSAATYYNVLCIPFTTDVCISVNVLSLR